MPPLTVFLSEDAKKLLHNKFIVIIGDSNHRGIYKDFIALLQGNEYLSSKNLKAKGEFHFMNDDLLEGGRHGEMTNGIQYREVRQYRTDYHLVRFYFVTKVFNKYWQDDIFSDLRDEPVPDVVIVNSCLWDISRYDRGTRIAMDSYKRNVEMLFSHLNSILPLETLILWTTTLPVTEKIRGGFMIPEIEYMCKTMRHDVIEANFYAKELARHYEIDILDLNFFFRTQMHRQVGDGTHWNYVAHRRITNLILAHIAVAWGVGPPRGGVPLTPARVSPSPQVQPAASNLYLDFDKVEAPSKTSGPSPRCPTPTHDEKQSPIVDMLFRQHEAQDEQRDQDNRKQETGIKIDKPANADDMYSFLSEGKCKQNRYSPTPTGSGAVGKPSKEDDAKSNVGVGSQPSGDIRRGKITFVGEIPISQSDGAGDHLTSSAAPHPGAALPSDIKLKPIDVGSVSQRVPSPSVPQMQTWLKDRAPIRAGNRFQPYAPRYQPQPQQQPQPYRHPAMSYPQPQLPHHVNSYVHQGQYNSHPNALYSYYNHFVSRMNQRVVTERTQEISRGLLYEAMLRFN